MTTRSPTNKQPLHSITSTSTLHPWQIAVAKKDISKNAGNLLINDHSPLNLLLNYNIYNLLTNLGFIKGQSNKWVLIIVYSFNILKALILIKMRTRGHEIP
jgi:hypothetical protein